MYSFLRGKLVEVFDSACVLDVNGVGYFLNITKKEAAFLLTKVGEELSLKVELIVKEDSHTLYGFSKKNTQDFFKLLIQLNGIGPRLALTILSELSVEDISKAVLTNDVLTLTGISGIGKKTAERMIIELKDKVSNFSSSETLATDSESNKLSPQLEEEVSSALLSLGYRNNEIKKMLLGIKSENISELTLEEILKMALKYSV
jgi:holliday junction DNA helicase RuvA